MAENTNLALVASTSERQITLYELCDKYLETLSTSSLKSTFYYLRDFKNFLKNKYLDNITTNDIQQYVNYKRANNLRDTTIYRYYRILKTLFNYAISHKYIEKNPCLRCKSEACFAYFFKRY